MCTSHSRQEAVNINTCRKPKLNHPILFFLAGFFCWRMQWDKLATRQLCKVLEVVLRVARLIARQFSLGVPR